MNLLAWKIIIHGLLIIITVLLTNLIIDPAHLFTNSYEEGIAKLLLEGKNVANVDNFDERLLQYKYISNLDYNHDLIVLGSSRSMQINSKSFKNMSFFNNSVPGASIEDYIGILGLYQYTEKLPARIIISVEPWIFNRFNGQTRWLTLVKYYNYLAEKLGVKIKETNTGFLPKNLLQLFSFSYYQASIKYFFKNLLKKRKQGEYFIAQNKLPNEDMIGFDGWHSYNKKFRNVTLKRINDKARGFISTKVYSLENFKQLDKNLVEKFENFVLYLIEQKIRVYYFLSPYHPLVYDFLTNNKKYQIINDVEKYIHKNAQSNNIPIIGSYNPNVLGLKEHDFYDGMHPNRFAVKQIIKDQFSL